MFWLYYNFIHFRSIRGRELDFMSWIIKSISSLIQFVYLFHSYFFFIHIKNVKEFLLIVNRSNKIIEKIFNSLNWLFYVTNSQFDVILSTGIITQFTNRTLRSLTFNYNNIDGMFKYALCVPIVNLSILISAALFSGASRATALQQLNIKSSVALRKPHE